MNYTLPRQRFIFFVLLTIIFFSACYEQFGELIVNLPESGGIQLQQNIQIIDSTDLDLISNAGEINNGKYRFTILDDVPHINGGDIIVGAQGQGFLRRVETISNKNNNELIMVTSSATLEDLFVSGDFNVDLNAPEDDLNSVQYELSDLVLYDNEGARITVNGYFEMGTDLNLDFSFAESRMDSFLFVIQNAKIHSSLQFNAETDNSVTIRNKSTILTGFRRRIRSYLNAGDLQVPIVVDVATDLSLNYSLELDNDLNTSLTFINDNQLKMKMTYENGNWLGTYENTPYYELKKTAIDGPVDGTVDLQLIPIITVSLYGVEGSFLSAPLAESMEGQIAEKTGDWDVSAYVWAKPSAKVQTEILGSDLYDFSQDWETERLTYQTPFKIKKIAGDRQMGRPNFPLKNPVQVQILDELGRPQPGVPVYISVTSGAGKVDASNKVSDSEGQVKIYWTLGPSLNAVNRLEVIAKRSDGTPLQAAPLTLTSNSIENGDISFTGTWVIVAHSEINCVDQEDESTLAANINGIICRSECASSLVCNNGCARTLFKFDESSVRIHNELYDYEGNFIKADSSAAYNYTFNGPNSFVLSSQTDPNDVFNVNFIYNDDELDLTSTEANRPYRCEEEILLRRL